MGNIEGCFPEEQGLFPGGNPVSNVGSFRCLLIAARSDLAVPSLRQYPAAVYAAFERRAFLIAVFYGMSFVLFQRRLFARVKRLRFIAIEKIN